MQTISLHKRLPKGDVMNAETQSNQGQVDQDIENLHLAEQHGLQKTTAYIRPKPAGERSAGAARVAKCRTKKKEQGIVQIDVPASIADAIKAAGSVDALAKLLSDPMCSTTGLTEVTRLAKLGRKVEQLPSWIRWCMKL
jgi:hypothetical protein